MTAKNGSYARRKTIEIHNKMKLKELSFESLNNLFKKKTTRNYKVDWLDR